MLRSVFDGDDEGNVMFGFTVIETCVYMHFFLWAYGDDYTNDNDNH